MEMSPSLTHNAQLATLNLFLGLGILFLFLSSCQPKPPEGMVLIPAGPFIMGTEDLALEELAQDFGIAKPWIEDATPAHRVDLPAYFMDQYEVTNAEYMRFVEARGVPTLPHWSNNRPAPEQRSLPVVYVSWMEAQAYCQWTGGRLPTEAEWEKAARGMDAYLYPWGNQFERGRANVGGVTAGLHAVGSHPKGNSPYGLSDMIGNAWEWIDGWYEPYPDSPYTMPEYGKRYRVIRGLSWAGLGHFEEEVLDQVVAAQARVTYRWYLPPNAAVEDVGFRCAKSLAN
jgi:formylglycine-generating enzyme required for sulfatase activity